MLLWKSKNNWNTPCIFYLRFSVVVVQIVDGVGGGGEDIDISEVIIVDVVVDLGVVVVLAGGGVKGSVSHGTCLIKIL